MALTQQLRDLLLGNIGGLGTDGGYRAVLNPHNAPLKFLHDGRVGDNDSIILILSPGSLSFLGENAENLEGEVLDPDGLPHRVTAAKQLIYDRLSDHGHTRGGLNVGIREEGSGRK